MERKLTAILSADVQGYSRLMGEDEEATIRTLTAYRAVMTTLIEQHRGRVVDSPGDNLLAEFASAVDAVRCAVEIQQELKVRNVELPLDRKMEFRIGSNVGDVIVEGEKIYGDGVNIAARLEGLAEPGGICISGTVHDQVENKLALGYEYLGEQTVKNIAKPVRVWRVRRPEAAAPAESTSVLRQAQHERLSDPVTLSPSTALRTGVSKGDPQAPALPLPDKPSIAVLPFVNLSSDPEQEYFSDGITEDLITDLSKISGLFVIARNSVFTYKSKVMKIQDIGREMGVRYALEGSVRKAGNQVRITAQLIDLTTGHHLWAERYDRELKDIFALQDEVTQKIVTALEVKLTAGEQARVGRVPTDNLEAYDYYLRGIEYLNRFTHETNAQARQLFEKAVALDPEFAAAYALLSVTYEREWGLQWTEDPQTLEQAFALAQKTVALDGSLPEAHTVLGNAYWWKKQYEQAFAEGERVITLDPNNASGHANLAKILNFAGKPEEALELVKKAMRLDPHYPYEYLFHLGFAYAATGRIEEAVVAFKRVLTRNPDFLPAHGFLAAIYSGSGREVEARAEVAEVLRISPNFSLNAFRQTAPVKDQEGLERFLDLLRKAGLK